ncbi:unnamed protein product [Psylliodes chrysocephalus]|uniref:Peptidase S1 domain-containing protein n=1 Tax=Psylliodes chrysocephalus TaxID=3402493 RepID=A0A9P0CAT5_9CUCU|nr:unnamed protein product [Psylliodes chrysocephala]
MFSAKVVILLAAAAVCYGAPNAKSYNNRLKIAGGSAANIEDYPFSVSVQQCDPTCHQICGGAIINNEWILTGARCTDGPLKVAVGANTENLIEVESEYTHANHPRPDGFGENDLTLLKLSRKLTFNDKVQPAKLPRSRQQFTGTAVLTGFANNIFQAAVDLNLVSNSECQAALEEANPHLYDLIKVSHLCTLNQTPNIRENDLGSPLSKDGIVIGTVTWEVQPYGINGAPNVFTRLASHTDWINDTITRNS